MKYTIIRTNHVNMNTTEYKQTVAKSGAISPWEKSCLKNIGNGSAIGKLSFCSIAAATDFSHCKYFDF